MDKPYDWPEPSYCRECGKEFYKHPEHAYKDDHGPYCSWSCLNRRRDKKKKSKPRYTPVEQLTLDGQHICTFQSANQAMEMMGYSANTGAKFRQACLDGGEYRGFKWCYKTN